MVDRCLCQSLHIRLKLVSFFEQEENGIDQSERILFTTSSGWEPKNSQVSELVWKIIEEDEKLVRGMVRMEDVWNYQ